MAESRGLPPVAEGGTSYESVGVDYDLLDAGKRQSISQALLTSTLAGRLGARAVDASRGEPAFVLELGGQTLALVLECLGTKSVIARQYQELTGVDRFDWIGIDTVAAVVNDLICVGALPVAVNAYFATGSASWYGVDGRHASLIRGWREGCELAGAVWGGGESPTLSGIVSPAEIDLAGCGVGVVPAGRSALSGADLRPGDEIVLVASTGLHTNGATLARAAAQRLGGLDHRLADGTTLGDALLAPSAIYVRLMERVFASTVELVYASHITGHGLRKLMRADHDVTYRITRMPDVPPVFDVLTSTLELSAEEAYGTFNMGAGFALYCRAGHGSTIVEQAQALGQAAWLAGRVEAGPRQVVLEPLGLTFGAEGLRLR